MAEQDNDDYSPARAATRAPIGRTIRLQFDDSMDVVEALCVNISIGGMFVAIQKARPKGSLVRFDLVLDDQRSVRGLGEVVWMRTQPGGAEKEAGIGVKFRFLEQRERQLIFKLVSQHIKDRLSKKPAEPAPAEAPQVVPQKAAPRPAGPQKVAPRPAGQPAEPRPALEKLAEEPVQLPMFVDPPAVPQPGAPQPVDDVGLEPATAEASARDERPPPAPFDAERPSFDQLFPDFDASQLEIFPDAAPATSAASAASASIEPVTGPGVAVPAEGTGWDGGSLWDEGLGGEEHAAPLRGSAQTRRRRAFPVLAIVLLLIALAAVGFFLFRAGLFEPAEPMIAVPPPPPARVQPPPAEPVAEPAPPPPRVQAPPPAEPAPPPAEPAPPPRPAAEGSFSKLVDVAWASDPRGLKVVLTTDGEIPEGRFRHFRLGDGQPREVIRLLGVRERFAQTELAVGLSELARIRIGYHREGGQNEVRVVLDLTAAEFGILAIEPRGSKLEIVIGKL